MKSSNRLRSSVLVLAALLGAAGQARAQGRRVLIHMKTGFDVDDAQICVVPNLAWAFLKAGDRVTILVDASAVTAVARGYGALNRLLGRRGTAMDRARLPARERRSMAEQMGVPLAEVPHDYGEYLDFLKKKGVEIDGNRTMMLLFGIDPAKAAPAVTPVTLERMTELFTSADTVVDY
ncbi:MAG: hypothetical protein KGL53_13750 [Elusimicrobia bacterium]|nr:hypothetical protein [Elusimicrobiota bacterium]